MVVTGSYPSRLRIKDFCANEVLYCQKDNFFASAHIWDTFYILCTWFERLGWDVESVGDEVATEAAHEGRHWTQHQGSNLRMILFICTL